MRYISLTLGCKVNQFETQAIETLLARRGLTRAAEGERADIVIVNTCAVTAESGRKSRQAIRRLQQAHPGAVLAVCGCYSQTSPEEAEALGADVVYGSGERRKFVGDVIKCAETRARRRLIDDPFSRRGFEALPAGAIEGRTRAYMKIQDGCENFCAYCIIPFARGRVRSMPVADAQEQARALQDEGYREIVVTGIEISSYGRDLGGVGLADVVRAIAQAAPRVRLRLGSIEPTVITRGFCDCLAGCGGICPHFHLSLQSGCDRTLKAMSRKYDTARFREAAALLRERFPGCALTADLIAGFPGETEEDHAATLRFIEECAFSAVHVFPYSVRPGTRAAAMDGQLPRAVRERRAREAQAVAGRLRDAYLDSQTGRVLPVLYESYSGGVWHGHSDNYCEVEAGGDGLRGRLLPTLILGRNGKKISGKIVDFVDLIE